MQLAIALVQEAGEIILDAHRSCKGTAFHCKPDHSPVSILDTAMEATMRTDIARIFPIDAICGEELGSTQAGQLKDSKGGLWIIDPLDGTQNFLTGIASFCVAVAFILDGIPQCAAVFDPVHHELYTAHRGKGAFLNGRRLLPPATPDPPTFGWSHSPGTSYDSYLSGLADINAHGRKAWDNGSASLMLCYVAAGRLAGCAEIALPIWDTVPGLLISHEAGCAVRSTDDFSTDLSSPMYAHWPECRSLVHTLMRRTAGPADLFQQALA